MESPTQTLPSEFAKISGIEIETILGEIPGEFVLLAVIVKLILTVLVLVGVPEIIPVLESIVKPAGKAGATTNELGFPPVILGFPNSSGRGRSIPKNLLFNEYVRNIGPDPPPDPL